MACLFHHSNTAYAWYAAGLDKDPSYSHFHPSILANYGALIHAQQLGATIFDFQGAGLRDKSSGVRQFKLRFGGTLTNTFRYRKLLWF